MRRLSLGIVLLFALSTVPLSVSAAEPLLITMSRSAVLLDPGQSDILTLQAKNNDSTIRDLNITLQQDPGAPWTITIGQANHSQVFPGSTISTTVAIDLAPGASLTDGGTAILRVAWSTGQQHLDTSIDLRVAATYGFSIDVSAAGNSGVVQMVPGGATVVSLPVMNKGNADDTSVLSVGQSPNLPAWWAEWVANNTPLAPTGSESVSITTPSASHNLSSSSAIDVKVNATNLQAGYEYNLTASARADGAILDAWSDYQTVNVSTSATDVELTWSGALEENYTLEIQLFDGAVQLVNSSREVCVANNLTNCSAPPPSSTSSGRSGSDDVTGVWLDGVLSDVAPGGSDVANLSLVVDAAALPGLYTLILYAGSAQANSSNSFAIVVEVLGSPLLGQQMSERPDSVMPGEIFDVIHVVSNDGSRSADVVSSVTSMTGPCVVALRSGSGLRLSASSNATVTVMGRMNDAAQDAEMCRFVLESSLADGSQTRSSIIEIGVEPSRSLILILPANVPVINPGATAVDVPVSVQNQGTETETVVLEATSPLGVNVVVPTMTTVGAGQTVQMVLQISVDALTNLSGSIVLTVLARSTSSSTISSSQSLPIEIGLRTDIRLVGPPSSSIEVTPGGGDSETNLTIINAGTRSTRLTLAWSGAPFGVTLSPNLTIFDVSGGGEVTLGLSVSASSTVTPGRHPVHLSLIDESSGQSLADMSLDILIQSLPDVRLFTDDDSAIVGPLDAVMHTFTVVNIGAVNTTYGVSLGLHPYHDASLSSSRVTLGPGAEGDVTLTLKQLREVDSFQLPITVTSEVDSAVTSTLLLTLVGPSPNLDATSASNSEPNIEPGESVTYPFTIRNRGTTADIARFIIPSSCKVLEEEVIIDEIRIEPSSSTGTLTAICTTAENADSGRYNRTVGISSAIGPDAGDELDVAWTVITSAPEGSPAFTLHRAGIGGVSIEASGASVLTFSVSSAVNAGGEVQWLLDGDLEGLQVEWHGETIGQTSTLRPVDSRSSDSVSLTLRRTSDVISGDMTLTVTAVLTVQGTSYPSQSVQVNVTLTEEERLAPAGLRAPMGVELTNTSGWYVITGGWGLAILLLFSSLRRRRKHSKKGMSPLMPLSDLPLPSPSGTEMDVVSESSPAGEGPDEVSRDQEGMVACTSCGSILQTPSKKEAPFRLRCPTCDARLRVIE